MFYNDLMFATNSYPNSNPNSSLVSIVFINVLFEIPCVYLNI